MKRLVHFAWTGSGEFSVGMTSGLQGRFTSYTEEAEPGKRPIAPSASHPLDPGLTPPRQYVSTRSGSLTALNQAGTVLGEDIMSRRLLGLVTALTLSVEAAEAQEMATLALSDTMGTEVVLAEPALAPEASLLRFETGSSSMVVRPLAGATAVTAPLYRLNRLTVTDREIRPLRESGGGLSRLSRHVIVGKVSAMMSGSEHALVGTLAQAVLGAAGGYLVMSMSGSSTGSKGSASRVDPNPETVTLKFKIRF